MSKTPADTLTMDSLKATIESLRLPGHSSRSIWPSSELAIIEAPHLVTTRAIDLTLWDRFRVWIENLADNADVYYHFPRVQRSVTEPMRKIVRIGNRLYCHPITVKELCALLAKGEVPK